VGDLVRLDGFAMSRRPAIALDGRRFPGASARGSLRRP
jgi:hypothetical protein